MNYSNKRDVRFVGACAGTNRTTCDRRGLSSEWEPRVDGHGATRRREWARARRRPKSIATLGGAQTSSTNASIKWELGRRSTGDALTRKVSCAAPENHRRCRCNQENAPIENGLMRSRGDVNTSVGSSTPPSRPRFRSSSKLTAQSPSTSRRGGDATGKSHKNPNPNPKTETLEP